MPNELKLDVMVDGVAAAKAQIMDLGQTVSGVTSGFSSGLVSPGQVGQVATATGGIQRFGAAHQKAGEAAHELTMRSATLLGTVRMLGPEFNIVADVLNVLINRQTGAGVALGLLGAAITAVVVITQAYTAAQAKEKAAAAEVLASLVSQAEGYNKIAASIEKARQSKENFDRPAKPQSSEAVQRQVAAQGGGMLGSAGVDYVGQMAIYGGPLSPDEMSLASQMYATGEFEGMEPRAARGKLDSKKGDAAYSAGRKTAAAEHMASVPNARAGNQLEEDKAGRAVSDKATNETKLQGVLGDWQEDRERAKSYIDKYVQHLQEGPGDENSGISPQEAKDWYATQTARGTKMIAGSRSFGEYRPDKGAGQSMTQIIGHYQSGGTFYNGQFRDPAGQVVPSAGAN